MIIYGGGQYYSAGGPIYTSETPVVSGSGAIVGQTNGISSNAAILKGKGRLIGQTNGAASSQSLIRAKGILKAQTDSIASGSAIIRGKGKLIASISGEASVSGTIRVKDLDKLIGSSFGSSFLTAIGYSALLLKGETNGTGSVAQNLYLKGKGRLVGKSEVLHDYTDVFISTDGRTAVKLDRELIEIID